MHLELMPDIQKALNANTIIHKASLETEGIRSTFKMIRAMAGSSHKMILHFLRSHVNIYWKDLLFDRSVFERKEVEGCDEDFVACFDVTTFEKLIEEIDSDIFSLYFVGENMVHVVGGDESLFGDTIRIQCTLKMDEEAFELLKEGDATLHTTL